MMAPELADQNLLLAILLVPASAWLSFAVSS